MRACVCVCSCVSLRTRVSIYLYIYIEIQTHTHTHESIRITADVRMRFLIAIKPFFSPLVKGYRLCERFHIIHNTQYIYKQSHCVPRFFLFLSLTHAPTRAHDAPHSHLTRISSPPPCFTRSFALYVFFFPRHGLGQIKGRMIIFNPWLH